MKHIISMSGGIGSYFTLKRVLEKQDKKGKDNDPFNWNYIDFYYKDKTYSVDIMIGEIDIKLHKAIHQQLIELGWIK